MTEWPKQRGKALTPRERQEQRKRDLLEHMREQVESGALRVRQMTDAEREARRVLRFGGTAAGA